MSTPAGRQQSSTATYSQAIRNLENARTRMATIQQQVQEAKTTLQAHYQGPDGQAYSQVMDTWLGEVDRIKSTCEAMETQLGNSMRSSNAAQGHGLDAVVGQGRLSALGGSVAGGAYAAMNGN